MKEKKLEVILNLFEGAAIKSAWDEREEDYYFSVVDVISALTDSDYQKARNYWKCLKNKLNSEGNELISTTLQLKMKNVDGKFYNTDTLNTKGILRLIESISSIKAEPFKMWLAEVGKERIDEVFDPEIAINRAINYYREKEYSDEWIQVRLNDILNRKKLTDGCPSRGILNNPEYVLLVNKFYKELFGKRDLKYKKFKRNRKVSL